MTTATDATHIDVAIRRAGAQDEAAIVELIRISLGEGTVARTRDYWRWKHLGNPFGQSPVMVAEHSGQLVGLRVFMRWSWQSGGRSVSTVRAVDTATHPTFRGRGIFKRLTLRLRNEMEAEGSGFVFNTPNAQSRPGYLKMGWSSVGKPTLWMRPVRPLRLARILRGEGLSGDEGDPPAVDAPPAAETLDQSGVKQLIDAASEIAVARLHTPWSLRYFKWRYADVPSPHYQAICLGEGAGGALLVLRARQRGALREIRLCDIVVGPTRTGRRNARRLLSRVVKWADVDVVIAMPAGSPQLQRLLMTAGYIPAPRSGPILTVYPFSAADALPDPRRPKSWGASIGDLELF